MLTLSGIIHQFDRTDWRLDMKKLDIKRGRLISIIGPNGSGKSTLLRIASGLLTPLKGRVELDGLGLLSRKRPAIARILGYLPQELSSEYDFTVQEVIRMGRYPHTGILGTLDIADLAAVEESLNQVGLEPLKNRRLSQLSGGEKKRVFLASILAQKPDILLLDEPTASLDLNRQVRFFRILKDLSLEGIGIAVVTHDLNLASLFSDRVLLLNDGECLAYGRPEDVIVKSSVKIAYGEEILVEKHPEVDRPALLPRGHGEKIR